jgi:hypothetical protein
MMIGTVDDATVFDVYEHSNTNLVNGVAVQGVKLRPQNQPQPFTDAFKFWNQPPDTAMIYTDDADYFGNLSATEQQPAETILQCVIPVPGTVELTPEVDVEYHLFTKDRTKNDRLIASNSNIVYMPGGDAPGDYVSTDSLFFTFVSSP